MSALVTCWACGGSKRHAHFPARHCGVCEGTGTSQCLSPAGVCGSPDECKREALCLGSDEGVAFQEACMKEFFAWLFSGQPAELPADRLVRDAPRSVTQENYEHAWRVSGGLKR